MSQKILLRLIVYRTLLYIYCRADASHLVPILERNVGQLNERVRSRDRRLSSANLERRIRTQVLALLTKKNQIYKPTRKMNE